MRKRYNTPHRSRVVKTRMTEEEYAEFAQRLSAYNMSQAEFIRQAITGAAMKPICWRHWRPLEENFRPAPAQKNVRPEPSIRIARSARST